MKDCVLAAMARSNRSEDPKNEQAQKEHTAPISGMPMYHWSPTVEGMIILKMSQIVSCQDDQSSHDHEPVHPFELTVHQNKQRKYEVHHHHGEGQFVVLDPGHEIGDLFRNIRIPDQHELGKPQVGPENTDTEHKFGQIMDMAVGHFFEVTFRLQIDAHQGNHGNAGNEHTGKYIPPEQGTEPVELAPS